LRGPAQNGVGKKEKGDNGSNPHSSKKGRGKKVILLTRAKATPRKGGKKKKRTNRRGRGEISKLGEKKGRTKQGRSKSGFLSWLGVKGHKKGGEKCPPLSARSPRKQSYPKDLKAQLKGREFLAKNEKGRGGGGEKKKKGWPRLDAREEGEGEDNEK